MLRGKRYNKLSVKVDKTKVYGVEDAAKLVKELATTKFDESVEVHVRLGIDVKKTDQMVRGVVALPHGIGKSKKVAVFAEGEKDKEAREAGADLVGGMELVDQIKQTGACDFDIAVATPDMMKKISPIAKVLGPKGLMPSPKTETVTMDIARTVKELKKGKVSFRSDDSGNVHQIIGKVSFEPEKIKENFVAFMDALKATKPATAKGEFIKGIYVTSTMGPSIKVKM